MVSLALVTLVIPLTQRSLDRIDLGWEGDRGEREALVKAAGDRLGGDLRSALQLTQRLADLGAAAAERDRDAAFRILARATASEQLESGIAILEADGTPWAWAGSHRLPPRAAGDSIASASSQYYVTLESRRHSGRDRVTVANVLVWAHPAVPDRAGSLAERFRASTDVALAVYPTDSAPDNTDVFDYCEPTTAGRRCLFSAQPLATGAGRRPRTRGVARGPGGGDRTAARAGTWPGCRGRLRRPLDAGGAHGMAPGSRAGGFAAWCR